MLSMADGERYPTGLRRPYHKAYSRYVAAGMHPSRIGDALSSAIQHGDMWGRLCSSPIDRIVELTAAGDISGLLALRRELARSDRFGGALIHRATMVLAERPELCAGHQEDLALTILEQGLESLINIEFLDVALMKWPDISGAVDPSGLSDHHREILRHGQFGVHARRLLEQSPVPKKTRPLKPKSALGDLLARSADSHVRSAG